jgi:acyl-CoA thioesterase FadM
VTYHRAFKFDDEFEVSLGVERFGRSSVTFGWHLVSREELCVEGPSHSRSRRC